MVLNNKYNIRQMFTWHFQYKNLSLFSLKKEEKKNFEGGSTFIQSKKKKKSFSSFKKVFSCVMTLVK